MCKQKKKIRYYWMHDEASDTIEMIRVEKVDRSIFNVEGIRYTMWDMKADTEVVPNFRYTNTFVGISNIDDYLSEFTDADSIKNFDTFFGGIKSKIYSHSDEMKALHAKYNELIKNKILSKLKIENKQKTEI